MITIFSTAKGIGEKEEKAIGSWLAMGCEVIMFGHVGTAGTRPVPVKCNKYGTPLVSDMFEVAQTIASYPIVGFVSSDIILKGIDLNHLPDKFLMVGQRWDENEAGFRTLHPPAGIAYFIFNRGLYPPIPAFAIGRTGEDNWLIYKARSLGVPVIDATNVITAIHQNHPTKTMNENERQGNMELMGGLDHAFTIEHATHILTPDGIKRALTPRRLYFRFASIPILNQRLSFLRKPVGMLTKLIIWVRRVLWM